jgi:hypothetical protein
MDLTLSLQEVDGMSEVISGICSLRLNSVRIIESEIYRTKFCLARTSFPLTSALYQVDWNATTFISAEKLKMFTNAVIHLDGVYRIT